MPTPIAFPMVRAGGLFIMLMGVGVILGGLFPRLRKLMLIVGAAAAIAAIMIFADTLTRPLGLPTRIQVWSIAGAIALEGILIGWVVARYRSAGERTFLLAMLLIVGFHFLPMAIAFGPLCALLSIALMANAAVGLWLKTGIPLNTLWTIDGAVKIAFGAIMFYAARLALAV